MYEMRVVVRGEGKHGKPREWAHTLGGGLEHLEELAKAILEKPYVKLLPDADKWPTQPAPTCRYVPFSSIAWIDIVEVEEE